MSGLRYCTSMNAKPLCLTPAEAMAAEEEVWGTVNNLGGAGVKCATDVLDYYCAMALPVCGGGGSNFVQPVAFAACVQTLSDCGVQAYAAQSECAGVAVSPFSHLAAPATRAVNPLSGGPVDCMVAPAHLSYCTATEGMNVAVPTTLFADVTAADAFVGQLVARLQSAGLSQECIYAVTVSTCADYLPACSDENVPLPMCLSTCLGILQGCDQTAAQAQSLCAQMGASVASCGYVDLQNNAADGSNGSPILAIILWFGVAVAGTLAVFAVVAVWNRRRAGAVGDAKALTEPLIAPDSAAATAEPALEP